MPGVEEEEEEREAGERGEGADADGGQRQAAGADRAAGEGARQGEEGADGHHHQGLLLVKFLTHWAYKHFHHSRFLLLFYYLNSRLHI